MSNHYCVRVYANGQAKHTIRDAEGMRGWIEYNSHWRPGNTLFVDGICQGKGYLDAEKIAEIESEIRAELDAGKHDLLRPERKARQTETFGGRTESYFGYPAEPYRRGFLRDQKERMSFIL